MYNLVALSCERNLLCPCLQVSILRGLKERYEVHHGVRLQDAALVSAAQLSHRYIADRFLPDKAIDLVDEAAAKLSIEASKTPCHWCFLT